MQAAHEIGGVRQRRGRRKGDRVRKVLQGRLEPASSIVADVIDKGPIGPSGIRRRAPTQNLGCQTARKRDPLWAPKRDPFFTVFERRGA